jgi:hypothetical protein
MQAFFPRVDLAAHRQQVAAVAAQLKENPPACPPPKLAVGRPKRPRLAAEALISAAAANEVQAEEQSQKRGKYTRWFNSPYINDILAAFARFGGSARATVAALKQSAPDNRI